jgi:purine-binding chemotaxis protein CheW
MAGKTSKKVPGNFEKMKREMTEKKQKATKQQGFETMETDIENNDCIKNLSAECLTQKQDESLDAVIENIDISLVEKELKEDADLKMQHEEKESTIEVKKIQVIVFKVDEEEFAIRISNIKEIIRVPAVTKIPNTPEYIAGLCRLRGDLLPVIDIRKLFNVHDKEFDESSRIIVADIYGKKVGLISDKVSEVISVNENDIKEPPSSIRGIDGGAVSGILMLNNGKRVVMLLDVEKIIKVRNLDIVANVDHTYARILNGACVATDEEEQVIIFNIGFEEYAFNIDHVREIITLPDIMKIPNSPSYIEGVFSIRNELLPVINLGKLFGINCKQPNEQSRVVILNNSSYSFGVVVDKVSHVISVKKKLFNKSSQMDNSHNEGYVKGIFNLNNGKRLVMLLEPLKLVNFEEVKGISDDDYGKIKNDKTLYIGEEDNNFEHIVVFKLGEEEYGIEINNVQEINKINEIAHFPCSPVFINGMVNLRGDIIPLLNLRRLFTDDDSNLHSASKFLAVEFENKRIGIIIDSPPEVLKLSRSCLQEATGEFAMNYNYVDKIAKLNYGKRIALILNLKAVLSFM